MRDKPISLEIEDAPDLKTLSKLSEEIRELLFKCLGTDKRTLRVEREKAYFKGRLQLYCTLYKKCRERFLKLKKQLKDTSNYYKEPVAFEELIKDFNWEKTVSRATPYKAEVRNVIIDDDDEDEDDEITKLPVIEVDKGEEKRLLINKLLQEMKTLFDRNASNVKSDAIEKTLLEFMELHKGETTPEVLQTVYKEIRKKEGVPTHVKEVITERVGVEESTETLTAVSATTAEKVEESLVGSRISFAFAGTDRSGVVLEGKDENGRFLVKEDTPPFAKHRVLEGSILKVESSPVATTEKVEVVTVETTTVEKAVEIPTTPAPVEEVKVTTTEVATTHTPDSKPFKEYDKKEKLSIVQSYYDGGAKKCGDVVAKMKEAGYVINHYDDVYNVFTKITK